MSTFPPTPEQSAIIAAVQGSRDNLIIEALAGAAKTSTLLLIAEAIPSEEVLAIAFNKKIATELSERMPPNVTCKTLNSLGHSAWGKYVGKRLFLDTGKSNRILQEVIAELSPTDKTEAFESYKDILNVVDFGASCGYVPDKVPTVKGIYNDEEFFAHIEENPKFGFALSRLEKHIVALVTQRRISEALRAKIDFADQILMSTLWPARFDSYHTVMVDEAQDLSLLNHLMVKKVVQRQRLIAVGDRFQAIYGFRGAHEDSMDKLRETFSMTPLALTISFRCPRAVAEHVRWRAPSIQSPEWAKDGGIRHLGEWSADTLEDSAAVICRNNAPILRTAMRLIRAGRKPQVLGNDITKGIVKDLKKLASPMTPQAEAFTLLDAFAAKLRLKYKNAAYIEDKILCLQYFIESQPTLGLAIVAAEQIMAATGPIQLMTGHKSKGLEFEHVYFLDEFLINPERGGEQENNLRYVICTRSKDTLTYVVSDGWQE
jgi:DNA helicase-2/ATP-dependent DNA helicase PcrA